MQFGSLEKQIPLSPHVNKFPIKDWKNCTLSKKNISKKNFISKGLLKIRSNFDPSKAHN
jgi:hypothetical protein